MLGFFDAREATALGAALADQYALGTAGAEAGRTMRKPLRKDPRKALEELLRRADSEIRRLQLNFYKKAKLANTFKWRLLEKGIERAVADEITQTLVMHVSLNRASSGAVTPAITAPIPAETAPESSGRLRDLLRLGSECFERGARAEAVAHFEEFVRLKPKDPEGHNLLGVALWSSARLDEAASHLVRAIQLNPKFATAHTNLGNLQRVTGRLEAAEQSLRHALKLKPADDVARNGLGMTLLNQGRVPDAKAQFAKVLKAKPRSLDALIGMGRIESMEGRFDEAERTYKRALDIDPEAPTAWASLAGLRKMTPADSAWRERVEALLPNVDQVNEANLRFALGKYYDDVGQFDQAFENFRRGNELMKALAKPYQREGHEQFIDDVIRAYTKETIASIGAGASDSLQPVFVVGMPRSGTSLVEQIIASHPAAAGAGELDFWAGVVRNHESEVRRGLIDESSRRRIANEYLRLLGRFSAEASRVVDKTPANTEFLGVIRSVFPRARIIHMSRDPIDTCLSCYFQEFSAALSYTNDLADLAHYYRQFHRSMTHWRAVLPAGTILDVPYEELVADQEAWTRRILEFIGLEWDDRCLRFQETQRPVATASTWQVRQKIYRGSVERWRKYSKYVGPLLELKELRGG